MRDKGDLFHLLYIKENCERAIKCTDEFSEDGFYRHDIAKYACVHFLEVIGEASKNISDELKGRYPQTGWKQAIGMRDRLAHDYVGTDFTIVWDTIRNVLPSFLKKIEVLIEELQ